MTRPRDFEGGTEFTNWIRDVKELDSSEGYVATDIDLMWHNYNNGKFMFIEEKRYLEEPTQCQMNFFRKLHRINSSEEDYYGYHIVQFEKEGPLVGKIFLDREEVSLKEFINFLKFENVDKDSLNKITDRPKPKETLNEENVIYTQIEHGCYIK